MVELILVGGYVHVAAERAADYDAAQNERSDR